MSGVEPPWAATAGPLAADGCDWIWDRIVETAPRAEQMAAAAAAWKQQAATLEERSPFYRELYAGAGVTATEISSLRDLSRLPTIGKDDLRRSQEEHPPYGNHLGVEPDAVKRIFQTSGSSGRPTLVALTAADLESWTTIGVRSYHATGIHPHHSVLTTLGAGPFAAGHTHATLDRIGVRRVPVGPGDVERALSAMELGLVDTVLATLSFALHLASTFDDRGIDGTAQGVIHLIVGGEPGGSIPAIRRRIEDAFGADVTEAGGIGDISPSLYGECPMKDGMHFCGQGMVWPELIDAAGGDPIDIEAGARGELVYTTLVREAMPLVRFRSGDVAEIIDTRCDCGRTSFKLRIEGRSDDMFIVRGVNVYPAAIQAVVADFEPAVTGRVRVVLPPGMGVAVEPPVLVEVELPGVAAPPPELAARIEAAIRARLTFRADVALVPQPEFGDAGYKTPPVVRRPAHSGRG